MNRNQTAQQHNFAIVPGVQTPRSRFHMPQTRKMAFDASDLIPIMCEPVLPGDVWEHTETIMARFATPIAPVVDDCDLETFYFWVPNRISWDGWKDFITGNAATTIPAIFPLNTGTNFAVLPGGVLDHFGLLPQVYSDGVFAVNMLPILAYFEIYNDWFRDQNLQDPWTWTVSNGMGTDTIVKTGGIKWNQEPLRINKRHDYFTSSLPWPQKGAAVSLPLGSTAPVIPIGAGTPPTFQIAAGNIGQLAMDRTSKAITGDTTPGGAGVQTITWNNPGLVTNLAGATAATINAIRLAIVTQQMLEKDARGGTRYVENILAHYGVRVPDFTAQRPEYLGGSKIPITVNPVAQTAAYDAEPDPTEASALGNLGAEMHASGHKRTFRHAATEHGYIIGLAAVRATPTYQQGTRRHWLDTTRLDIHFPEFSNLGEQSVKTQEIYQPANNAPAVAVWGYQERSAQYRYTPNEITGVLRSTAAQPLDWWHYAEEFSGEPALNAAFITDKTKETLARSLATAPNEQWSAQIIMDIRHDSTVARLMPAYSVPGLTRF